MSERASLKEGHGSGGQSQGMKRNPFPWNALGKGQPSPAPAPSPPRWPRTGGAGGGGGKKAARLPHGSQTLAQLLRVLALTWVPFLHSHTCVHAHTHITHLAGHSHRLASVLWVRGGTLSWDSSKEPGLGSGGIKVALSVSEQNLHVQRESGFRPSDLREAGLGTG